MNIPRTARRVLPVGLALGLAVAVAPASAQAPGHQPRSIATSTVTPASPAADAKAHHWRDRLPHRMRYVPPEARQLITVRSLRSSSRTARLDFWFKDRRDHWHLFLTTRARLGWNGTVVGSQRRQSTGTTPRGLYRMSYGFGTVGASSFPHLGYRPITHKSYWCEDNRSRRYNRWVERYPMRNCRPSKSEHLADYQPEYSRAVVIKFNWRQVRHRGAGIFLHVNGDSWTAGCVSVSAAAMRRIAAHLRTTSKPSIAIGLRGEILDL